MTAQNKIEAATLHSAMALAFPDIEGATKKNAVFAQRTIVRTFDDVFPAIQQCTGVIWNQLPDDPFIFVSEDGEVVSLHKKRARVLKPGLSGMYPAVSINGRTTHIHRIVCEMWNGPPPFQGAQVRHLDGNRFNAKMSNLAWGSAVENAADKFAHGTDNSGERNPMAKLTSDRVAQMRDQRASGQTFKAIAKRHGVATMTAHRAITGGSWK